MRRTLGTMVVGAVVTVMVAACGGQEPSGPDFAKLRVGGKADGFVSTTLSCQGSCGSIVQDLFEYCGCDDLCTTYGDCCTDKATVCDGSPTKAACDKINADYQKELVTAAVCKADAECGTFVGGNLSCGMPTKALNSALTSQVTALQTSWSGAGCHQIDWNCPMLSPLPPWMAVRGVCEQGACKAEYYDTRGAKEGASCGDDINVECADGLYCAFGLNWCGTPPVTGVCRKMGDCGATSDCLNDDNDWIHPACMGQATCTAGQCGWSCGL